MALEALTSILSKQNELCLDARHVIIALHMTLGHDLDKIAQDTGYRKIVVKKTIADLEAEGFLKDLDIIYAIPEASIEPATIQTSSRDTLSSVVSQTVASTRPKKKRKAIPKKAPRKTGNKTLSPLEVAPSEWDTIHLIRYFEIRWFEQNWKTPLPSWKVKDRANAKRILEEFSGGSKDLVDYLFDNYNALRSSLNLTSLPTMGVLWGFRTSLAPMALGDVTNTTKGWGSAHDDAQDRSDGDEMGW
jgi:hypothetical protein